VDDSNELMRLWTHEMLRVFHDRLTDDVDREWLVSLLKERTEVHFKVKFTHLMRHVKDANGEVAGKELRNLIFCDFLVPGGERQYDEVSIISELFDAVNTYLNDYNGMTKAPMNLVIFLFAIEHLSRICRIIKQPGGHALLVGVGGSGRQSLTRLAASIEEFEVFQVEISKGYGANEWRDDLKKVLRLAGESNKPTVFLMVGGVLD
jgi:dynein heavy chain